MDYRIVLARIFTTTLAQEDQLALVGSNFSFRIIGFINFFFTCFT
jgi:hypothetical protein